MKNIKFLLIISVVLILFSNTSFAFEAVDIVPITRLPSPVTANEINCLYNQHMGFVSAQCNSKMISVQIFSRKTYDMARASLTSKKPVRITYICSDNDCHDCSLVRIESTGSH